ncbi:MAG: hypothetical protein ACRD0Q_12225 [Acidimicrobiales bacterium]
MKAASPAAVAILGIPAAVGTLALIVVTRLGPYASPDSVFYVGVARRLVDGRGFVAPPGTPPIGSFPPLFPLLLAGLGSLGLDPLDAAGWINPVIFGLTVLLVAVVVARHTGSLPAGLVAGLLVLGALELMKLSSSALSEPLFILLSLASLATLAAHLDRPRTWCLGVAMGLASAAVLTRYAGLAVPLAGAAALAGAGRRRHTAAFAVLPLLPAAGWLAWAGGAHRPLRLHPFGVHESLIGIGALSRWVLPETVPWPVRFWATVLGCAALVAAGAAIAVLARTRGRPPRPSNLTLVLLAFGIAYVVVVVGYRVVLDETGRFDSRLLAPVHIVAVVLAVAAVARHKPPRSLTAAGLAVVGVMLVQAGVWTARGLGDQGIGRRGYSAAAWRNSSVVAEIARLDAGVPVYSNGADAVFLLTGRTTATLPATTDYLTGRRDPAFSRRLAAVGTELERTGGLLAYFPVIRSRRAFMPSQPLLESSLPLQLVRRDRVGALYRVVPSPDPAAAPLPRRRGRATGGR